VIDTKTIREGGEGGGGGGQSEESQDTQIAANKQTSTIAQQAGIEAQDPLPQEMTYRTVRKQRSKSRTPNPFNKTQGGWEAAKVVMG